jgi:hypothetical protein
MRKCVWFARILSLARFSSSSSLRVPSETAVVSREKQKKKKLKFSLFSLSLLLNKQTNKRRIQKWYTIYKDHITLDDYEVKDGSNLELYYN